MKFLFPIQVGNLIVTLRRLVNNIQAVEIFFSVFLKLLWRLTPCIFQFTRTISIDKSLIAFRPFILSDLQVISPNFEPDVRTVFQPKPNERIIDVGAHIGLYTIIAGRKVGSNGKVISIEPDTSNLFVLKKNIAINNLKNTIVLPIALGCANGRKKFYGGIMPTGSSFYPTPTRALYKVRETKEMATVTLDKLLEELKIRDVDWIKIDVENADLDVLRGGESFLQNSKKVKIIIEVSNNKTLKFLKKFGFQIRQLSSSYHFAFKN